MNTTSKITDLKMEAQIRFVKQYFGSCLGKALQLHPVFAPLFVKQDSGINDDLCGTEKPVVFSTKNSEDTFAIVHSLAKWKRIRLKELQIPPHEGIITDMIALRPDEGSSPIHSVLVDQWDWEMVIRKDDRTLSFLKKIVRIIYEQIYRTMLEVGKAYPHLQINLPEDIMFVHTEDLLKQYPDRTAKEREQLLVEKYGAVFLIGIGGRLKDGSIHDQRAADYDDWSTPTEAGYKGLNGDILLWHDQLKTAFEISSMGIRVDRAALLRQLKLRKAENKINLPFHQALLNDELPPSIGGGIGQSRLAMFMLQQENIAAVQYCYAL